MDALWIIIVIVAVVYRVLNKAGEITGEMKDRLPGGMGEKRFPPVTKDWGFPWDDENEWDGDNGWGEYPESREKGAQAQGNKGKDIQTEALMETPTETPMENARETSGKSLTNIQQEKGAVGIDRYPVMDSASLVNGLILSEILQPPKSRRVGRRF